MTEDSEPAAGLRFIDDWQNLADADAAAIREFWLRENANVAGAEAERRLREVVVHAATDDGRIAAVATVGAKILPRLGQPMYAFRCFVGTTWRSGILPRTLMKHCQRILAPYAREQGFPCIGIVAELENARFGSTMRRAYWSDTKMIFIGTNAKGQDVRVWYFPGAKLKTPAELARLVRTTQQHESAGATAARGR